MKRDVRKSHIRGFDERQRIGKPAFPNVFLDGMPGQAVKVAVQLGAGNRADRCEQFGIHRLGHVAFYVPEDAVRILGLLGPIAHGSVSFRIVEGAGDSA